MKTALITGATGFVGGSLVEASLARGFHVRALVSPGNPRGRDCEARGAEIVYADIRDREAVRRAASGVDVIFHCAAVVTDWAPWRLFEEVTAGGTENVCEAARATGVSCLVHISTNDVFGRDETEVMDESFPLRAWNEPYPDAKIAAERITWTYSRERGLPVTMVYPCWVYGEGDRTFVPLLADAIRKRELIFWRRDALVWPTYIDNLVELLMLIAEDERAVGSGYLVHDGESTTLQQLCSEIARSLGVPPIRTHIPYSAAYALALVMEAAWKLLRVKTRPLLTTYTVKSLGSRLRFSIHKAERELGWTPRISYREGLARTMEWLGNLDLKSLKRK